MNDVVKENSIEAQQIPKHEENNNILELLEQIANRSKTISSSLEQSCVN